MSPSSFGGVPPGALIGKDPFVALAGELCLAMLVDVEVVSANAIRSNIFAAACEAGFRDNRTGDPPDDRAVSWALHETLNLCRALGLLCATRGVVGPSTRVLKETSSSIRRKA